MKNIQVIDDMPNAAYDIFACSDGDFEQIFLPGTDIEFIEDVVVRLGEERAATVLSRLWTHPVVKSHVQGIHGILFYGLEDKKRFYPNKRDSDLDGTGRAWRHDLIDRQTEES